jgi:hypothetical protein
MFVIGRIGWLYTYDYKFMQITGSTVRIPGREQKISEDKNPSPL